jgi:PAS domain S-box-containing protein
LSFVHLFSSQLSTNNLAKICSNSLYNLDDTQIKNIIKSYLINEKDIKAIEVIDSTDNSTFLTIFRDKSKLIFNKPLPNNLKHLKNLKVFSSKIKYNNEIIGYITVFYLNSKIKDKVPTNWALIAKISGVVLLLILFILFNNKKLKSMVEEQTADIKQQKAELEDLTTNLELKITQRTKDFEVAKQEIEQILANILLPVLITSKKDRVILYANKYAEHQYEKKLEDIIGSPIDSVYTVVGQYFHIVEAIKKYGFIENSEETFKTSKGRIFTALLSVTPITYRDEDCYIGMVTDITKQKEMEKEIRAIHKHTRDSIEYASLIQGALIPQKGAMSPYFKDHFVTWTPKDTVGGDIWLFNELRHKDECLLFFIDCTGHGVPGAFVTMIVKAVEREVISNIKKHPDFDISPAIIMGYFNKTMKTLLRQETKDSLSNAGWDGGIIYYNRREQVLKFAGAETPLFYIDEKGEFKTIKGNRYSVGYKKCDSNYKYNETIINVKEGMKFFCTTDGYLDQNGGEKDFPFGKKRFSNIIKENYTKSMNDLQNIFIDSMTEYESMIENNDRNDDMTLIGFEIGSKSVVELDFYEEIIKYEGLITQNFIGTAMDNIEYRIKDLNLLGYISTIVIEMCQNIMNYAKDDIEGSTNLIPEGYISVIKQEDLYFIESKNILSLKDKDKIEPTLKYIQSLDKQAIKKEYRKLRKSGINTHEKGGGIGMYEIAKVSDRINYEFIAINKDKYHFIMQSYIKKG